jgi:hypothetical protein
MTDAYTPTANYRLVVPVDETDVRFAARYGLKVGHPKSANRILGRWQIAWLFAPKYLARRAWGSGLL